jgi:hypothetical protein
MRDAGYKVNVTVRYYNNVTREYYPDDIVPNRTIYPNLYINYTIVLYGPPLWMGHRPRQIFSFVDSSIINPYGRTLTNGGCYTGCAGTTGN